MLVGNTDGEAVGAAGERLFEQGVEAIAGERVVAIDMQERAAVDELGDGVPDVGFEIAPLEELGGDVGLVAELDIRRDGPLGAQAGERVFGAGGVVQNVVVGAVGRGIDARVDHAVGGAVEAAHLGRRTGDGGIDHRVVNHGGAVVTLVPIPEVGGVERELEIRRDLPTKGGGERIVALGVAVDVTVGFVVAVIEPGGERMVVPAEGQRAAPAESEAIAVPCADAREQLAAGLGIG